MQNVWKVTNDTEYSIHYEAFTSTAAVKLLHNLPKFHSNAFISNLEIDIISVNLNFDAMETYENDLFANSGNSRKIKVSPVSVASKVGFIKILTVSIPKLRTLMQLLQTVIPSRLFLACTVDARLNMLKSLGIGAKDLPLPPLPPTVIQGSAMASDNGVGNATSVSTSGNCTTVVYTFPEEDHLVVGYLNEWINAYSFITSEYTIGRSLLSAGKPSVKRCCYYRPRRLLPGLDDRVVCPTRAKVGERYFSQ